MADTTNPPNKIFFKFKSAHGIQIPGSGILSPKLWPSSKLANGKKIAVQDYHLDDREPDENNRFGWKADIYEVALLPDKPADLPASMAGSHESVKNAFHASQAGVIANNVAANALVIKVMEEYQADGRIEILKDAPKDEKPAAKATIKPEPPAESK